MLLLMMLLNTIDYYRIYSHAAPSLAVCISLIAVFVALRLRWLDTEDDKIILNLRNALFRITAQNSVYETIDDETLFAHTQKVLKDCKTHKQVTAEAAASAVTEQKKHLDELECRKNDMLRIRRYRQEFRTKAVFLIFYFSFLFTATVICLIFTNYFEQNPSAGLWSLFYAAGLFLEGLNVLLIFF